MRTSIEEEYFYWMCRLVSNDTAPMYLKLLKKLHSIQFNYILVMDANREADGIELRYRFGHEQGYDNRVISMVLDNHPCTVLEMMVALAVRCEEHIMNDPELGDRTAQWFWGMVENLGLISETDDNFHEIYVEEVITRFLDHDYEKNGKGGLFTVEHCGRDLRTVEIWCQLCWYLDEMSRKGD